MNLIFSRRSKLIVIADNINRLQNLDLDQDDEDEHE